MIVLSNAAVWATWSLLTGEYAAGIPGLINGPAAILILHRLMIAHHKRRIKSQMTFGPAARSLTCARQPVDRPQQPEEERAVRPGGRQTRPSHPSVSWVARR
jgi:hypothetical protein